MVMNRKRCKPTGEAAHGLSSSAMASTGPKWVETISSTTAPGLRGLSTRSSPPLAEKVWSLAEERCPSPNRTVAGSMLAEGAFERRRAGWGVELIGGNMLWNQPLMGDYEGPCTPRPGRRLAVSPCLVESSACHGVCNRRTFVLSVSQGS